MENWVSVNADDWRVALYNWPDVMHLFNNDSFHNFIGGYEADYQFIFVSPEAARKIEMLSSPHFMTLVKVYIIRGSIVKK